MAWVADAEFPSDEYNTYHPMTMFPGDEERLAEAEAQVVAEVRAKYEKDPVKGPRSLWYNPHEDIAGLQSGWRWPMNEQPYRYRLEKPTDWMPDIGNGITERVVDLIEAIEPGVHQYLPAEIYNSDGSFRERRWLLNICNQLDTLVPEHSNIVVSPYGRYMIGNGAFQVSAWKEKIDRHAIWNEYRVPMRIIHDQMYEGIKRNNIRGWDFSKKIDEI